MAASGELWRNSSCVLYDYDVSLKWTLGIQGKVIALESMFLKTIRVGVGLSTERLRANQILALGEAAPMSIRGNACWGKHNRFLYLSRTQLQFGSAAWSVSWMKVKRQQSWWCLHFSSVVPVWLCSRGRTGVFHSAALFCLHCYVSLFIAESLLGGFSERVVAVGMLSL